MRETKNSEPADCSGNRVGREAPGPVADAEAREGKPTRYCGRDFPAADLATIRRIIEQGPELKRRAISQRVCEALGWLKRDGGLKEMSCRVALLRMERNGLVQLPPPRSRHGNGRRLHRRTSEAEPGEPLCAAIGELGEVCLSLVGTTAQSLLWNEYIDRYHYLGYGRLPGAQLRYIARASGRVVALLGFGAAAWKTAPRDTYIGWTPAQRERQLHLVVNNARFLILPWVSVPHLASKVLGMAARRLPADWERRYNYRPVLLETFVEQERFAGTSYRAANWLCVGETQGRGKLDRKKQFGKPIKSVWVLPLARSFRRALCGDRP